MQYLLDSVVLCEPTKRRPEQSVLRWIESTDANAKYISILTIAEIRRGIALMKRREPHGSAKLALWLDAQRTMFADRVLPIEASVATAWSVLGAARTVPVIDSLIAATALAHDLTLVTRNTRDFTGLGVRLLNPWQQLPR